MKCDMHVHTVHSGPCHVPLLSKICRESYNDASAVYRTLKGRGMDLVTVTDHDAVSAGAELQQHSDFFLSVEVTCSLPSGTGFHLGVYDLDERQHEEIQHRRDDLFALVAYLREQQLFASVNHVFSALTGERVEEDFLWFRSFFPALETLNGAILVRANGLARDLARLDGKIEVGGSDSHAMFSLGCAYTEVPEARTKQEFFDGLRAGRGRAAGAHGSYWKLVSAVSAIGRGLIRDVRPAWLLSPLFLVVPVYVLGVVAREAVFASRWRAVSQPPVPIGIPAGVPEVGV